MIKLVHHFYVVCLLHSEQSLFSSKICKRDYLSSEVAQVVRAQIRIRCSNTLAYRFSSKRETAHSLYVFQCLQTFLLFSDRLNWRNNTTSNHENSFLRCLHDLATELIVGNTMYKSDKQCKFYILGQGSTHLFIYLLFFILLLHYVAANAFGIWNLRNTGKSVTNWVTHMLSYTLH